MRRLYGVTDERTQMAKIRYLHMKDDTQRLICRTLHEHNGMVMQKLKEDGSKKRMFNHIMRLMRKQEQKDTSIKILNSSGITVNDEQEVVKEVERFWGNLFCTNGKVTLGQKKEMIGNGMTSEGQIFSQQEMSVAIKKMKDNKAADESGVIVEYLKALEVEEVEKLRGLMNGILNGADIPKEWKESRVKLLHKGGRTDELKNYRPITIINITCKLCMLMVRERIDKWTEDSGMLGEIQGDFRRGRRTEGIMIEGGKHGGFKSMGDRMKEANGLIGMVKYAAERSGSKYVIGREGWKTMIVSKLMYGCGALAWYQRECDDLEVIQNGFGRWLWEVGNVWNELVRGESGWSSFAEREVKCIVDWLLRIVYEESLVSDIGRACLMEVGYKSRWWARCNHVCDKFGLWELVNLLWLKNINKEGMAMLGMKYDRNVWKKTLVAIIQEDGRRQWRNVFSA